jgi:hypothetical protein
MSFRSNRMVVGMARLGLSPAKEGVQPSYARRVLRLAFLLPDLKAAILAGRGLPASLCQG